MSVTTSPPSSPPRSSSGFSLLSKIKSHKEPKYLSPPRPPAVHRAGSFGSIYNQPARSSLFSLPAQEGAGLKSRRLSATLLDDFVVDVCPLEDEFVSASKFGRRKEIGKGASATVKIMLRKGDKKGENPCQYAVKEFRKKSARETEEEYVRKVKSEYTIAKSLSHPNIVQTVRLCTNNGRWNHVMEYCQQGELFSLVERKYFKAEDRNCIFKQVLRGVNYLHEHGIAHRDIKLENLLMTDEGYIKITDFGVSEVFCGDHPGVPSSRGLCGQGMRESRQSAPGICGSKPYISPEVLAQDREYDPTKLDVWSCGILFMTMFLGGNPWQSASKSEVNYALFWEGWRAFLERFSDSPIDENTYPQCGPIFNALPSHSQRRCILKMLHPHPEKRCSIREALNGRWIKGVDCCSPEEIGATLSNGIDVSKMGCHQVVAKMKVQAKHDHLPPPIKRLPQHRFDMGDGTSRYD
ncbi:uncharacterized protein Z518_01126 [Rhinocladiella mackenziei CBS 650.93]|uniref:Protein kinase domain-containing protein n=1 Tax=Rhinocladiella mackenziei CBS 650.93 TaxID=1442369 RepID=A0A0D2JKS4_9EURO|nr:uncharacterized protein Z518_01126 [Rhinocladiella mackenziei CBS 650.93]KIX10045.1 hypothetical protein Z518_01126 [Rhinocladiella mackenziei CBS 650.93]